MVQLANWTMGLFCWAFGSGSAMERLLFANMMVCCLDSERHPCKGLHVDFRGWKMQELCDGEVCVCARV